MGKTRKVCTTERRTSVRLSQKSAPIQPEKKKVAAKKVTGKAKKVKATENGSPKAEEAKAEATETK